MGIWSDGTTLWVSDWSFDAKIYAYNMPRSDTPTVCVEATTAPDFSADRNTLGTVDIGGSVCSQIEPAYDIDWFAVDLVEGSTYVIDLEGRATNAGTLFDPILSSVHITRAGTGRGVAQVMGSPRSIRDDNDGEGNDSRLMFTVVEPGRYYIATRGFASHTGTYVLSVNRRTLDSLRPIVYPNGPTGRPLILLRAAPAPDPGPLGPDMPDSTTTTATVIVNGVNNDDPDDDGRYHGQIDTPDDRDWIRVWLKSKKAYVIHMLGAGNAWSEDENSWRLTLRGPQIGGVFRTDREPGDPHPYGLPGTGGTPTNDRWAAGPQSAAYFTATETGWHYIQAQAQSAVQTGTYAVHVFDLSNPWGAPAPAPPTFALSTGEPPGRPQDLTGTVAHDVVSLTWDDPDDASITGYQILRLDRDVHGVGNFQVHVDDTGSAAATYVDWNVEPETRYVYRIKARSAVGLSARSKYFNANTPPAPDPAPNNPATGAPTIKGTAEVGKTLTADTSGIEDADGLDNASFGYQWLIILGAASADIPGATDATYTPTASDEGIAIQVRVSFTDDAGNEETLTSAATEAVMAKSNSPATGAPTISGVSRVGETLTAETSGIGDADGLDDAVFSYQWMADGGNGDTDIAGATDRAHTLTSSEEGKVMRVRVSFTDDAGNDESPTSVATVAVIALQPPGRPQGLTGTVAHDVVSLTWDDPDDASITGYQILRRDRDTSEIGAFTAINDDTGSAATTYVDDKVEPGTRYVYKIKAINPGGLSAQSHYVLVDTPAVEPKANSPATGVPTISGTAQVGETLMAETSGIEDKDGLSNVSYSYQWLVADAGISGATGASYALADGDEGKTVKVTVSFTDDAGNEESLTSEATSAVAGKPNSPATGAPTIGGTVQVGETLTANVSGIADEDGLDNAQFSYQWLADDAEIAGATGSAYTLVDADEEETIKVNVSFTDDAGNGETLTSAATATVATKPNSPATGAPAITGTAQVGETLTADTSGIADADGLSDATFSYQWIANDGTSDIDMTGATDSTYTLVAADEGKTVKVWVSFTDDAGNNESLTSTATEAVSFVVQQQVENSAATGAPAINGTAQVGERLTVDTSGIVDSDGLDNAAFSYQWIASDGTTDTDIEYATDVSYKVADADEGNSIKVRVSFTDDADNEETLTSAATARVEARPNSPATGAPIIGGTVKVGETLTVDTSGIADADGLDTAAFSHRWLADGIEITGATSSSYTVKATDLGKTLKVRVSYTDDRGAEESVTSAATEAVVAKPNSPATGAPVISGTVQVDETLTADTSGIADADGLETATFSYQWLADDVEITGATSSSYTLVGSDEGNTIQVQVSFSDDAGNEETLTSAATPAVAAAEPEQPPSKPRGLTGTVAHDQVSLTWTDPGDASITGYQILRRNRDVDAPGKFQVHVDDTGSAAASYVDRDVAPETRYVYRIKARNGAGLSVRSHYFGANTPPTPNHPATGLPTINGTARVGETLTADASGIEDADGLDNATFSYQWIVSDGGGELEIEGATDATYTLIDIDAALRFMVRVSFTDDGGNEETLTSEATAVVAK